MKNYILGVIALSFLGCSTSVPNSSYYQSLYYDGQKSSRPSYIQGSQSKDLKETLYKEREWHRRQMAQKDATIEGLRKELYETRAYVTELMNELNKAHSIQRKETTIYRDSPYQNMSYSELGALPEVIFVNAATEVREPIQSNTKEDDIPAPLQGHTARKSIPTPTPAHTSPMEEKPHGNQDVELEQVEGTELIVISDPEPEDIPEVIPEKMKSKKVIRPQTKQVTESQRIYSNAMELMKRKKYVEARAIFESFIQRYPKDTLMPNAWYWKGETFYSVGAYAEAIVDFMHVVNEYGKSHKAPDALLKIIMSYAALKDIQNAEKYKAFLLKSYPHSSSAKRAQQMVL